MKRSTMPPTITLAVTAVLLALFNIATASDRDSGKHCTLSSLKGKYGYTYQGTVEGFGGISAVGPIKFDGDGHTSATYSVNLGGTHFKGTFTGVYSVNDNCTGKVRLDLPLLGTSSHGRFVIVGGGEEAFFMGIDEGVTVTGVAKRVGPVNQ